MYQDWPISCEVWDLICILYRREQAFLKGVTEESGIYDSSPFKATLSKVIDTAKLKASDRMLSSGATSLSSGDYVVFDKNGEDFGNAVDALLASSSLPGIFPHVISDKGEPFISAAIKQNLPVLEAINKCHSLGYSDIEITAVLSLGKYVPGTKDKDYSDSNTVEVLYRVVEIMLEYFTVQDLQEAADAYPQVRFRFFGPSQSLPGINPLDYIPSQSATMMNIGYQDGLSASKSQLTPRTLKELVQDKVFQDFIGFELVPKAQDFMHPLPVHQSGGTCNA